MNERIKAWIKEVGEDCYEYSEMAQDVWFNKEKFAELIVRECCSKLVEMGEGWHEFAKNPPDGQAHNASGALFAAYRLKEDAVDEIKEHFGVEE
jgi:hypothetical protein